jgi:hypothetical protein
LLNGNGAQQGPSRLQRARAGIRVNRRMPSKEDYSNFALYQANQKAYEATFLKNFVAHALHPDQIRACFEDSVAIHTKLHNYMKAVSAQVNRIARKMAWNAHFRVIHLLANDDKNGAPFLDVHTINPKIASDFGPDNIYEVARKMNGSWHRASPQPVMVRFSTQHYSIESGHTMPLEEIDEVCDTLFNKNAFAKALPTGRAFRAPVSKKRKGQHAPGAAVREEHTVTPRGNWLTFTSLDTHMQHHSPPPKTYPPPNVVKNVPVDSSQAYPSELFPGGGGGCNNQSRKLPSLPQTAWSAECHQKIHTEMHDAHQEPLVPHEPRNVPHRDSLSSPSAGPSQPDLDTDPWLEELFGEDLSGLYGPDGFGCDRVDSPTRSDSIEHVEKVLSWRMRLINDHKQRLTRKWGNPPQILEKALPGIKQALAAAYAKNIRPTAHDYHKTLRLIGAREQRRPAVSDRLQEVDAPIPSKTFHPAKHASNDHPRRPTTIDLVEVISADDAKSALTWGDGSPSSPHTSYGSKGKGRAVEVVEAAAHMSVEPPSKRRRTGKATTQKTTTKAPIKQKRVVKSSKEVDGPASSRSPVSRQLLPPHPSGSKTLEPHQQLPPDAYFTPTSLDERPVWRCGAKHAMGHYYNAGDRKSCRGCNTSLSDNAHIVEMDFYLPARSFHYQSAPGMKWKPNKPSGNPRKSDRPCHNAVAKDAYWTAINAGATEDEARQMGVNAVEEYLKPKPPPKEPTPEPTPEPEPDLGPHPSGSTMMEHGQELPECAYWAKEEQHEEFAWRCDVNHALGRYYLAGDKKSCPGCGSNKGGLGKHAIMDFYMPPGVMVREEAPHLVKWKPRKYKARVNSKSAKPKTAAQTHNQICAEKYFQAIDEGHEDEEALRLAIEATDAQLEEKQEEMLRKHGEQDEDGDDEASLEVGEASTQTSHSRNDSGSVSQTGSSKSDDCRRNSRGGFTGQLGFRKRNINDLEDDEMDEVEEYQTAGNTDAAPSSPEIIEFSSGEEETSGSDSE